MSSRPYLRSDATLTERLIQFGLRHGGGVLNKPFAVGQAAAFAAGLLIVAVIYCQIYCLLALQQMHGSSMPLQASLSRVGVDVLPGYAAFELSKRVSLGQRPWEWWLIGAIFCVAFVVATVLRLQLHIMTSVGVTARHMAVDRLPYLLFALAGVAWFRRKSLRRETDLERSGGVFETDKLPPAGLIDWMRAAGNYVEVHFAGRSRLFRLTLRGVAECLPQDEFVQIHRSVIVRRGAIQRMGAPNRLIMNDGSELPIGDTFRARLETN